MQKEIDVTVPFDTIKKTYPDGSVVLKKLKFTGYKIKQGYESETDEERWARHEAYKQVTKPKDTYGSVVADFRDRQYMRLRGIQMAMDCAEAVEDTPHPDVQPKSVSDEERTAQTEEKRRRKILYNIAKTRNKIFDIARSNEFNYFITLTYASDKCDRYSFTDCSAKVRKFMNHFKSEHKSDCPNFKYLLVHEQHKDGAYHYHGLIYLEDTSTLKLADCQPKGCKQTVYNWGRWKNGFSTVTEIQDADATRKYILKYISKNIDEDYQKGQRHFYYSQNCLKPEVESMVSDKQMLMLYDLVYDTERSTGYESTVEKLDEMAGLIADLRYGLG